MTEAEKRIRAAVGVLDPAVLEAARKELDSAFIDCTLHAQVAIHVGRYLRSCSPENIAALLAEIDRLTRERDEARAERDAMANVLPGYYYMDPPDGGDVPVLEQLRRMAKDAERYRRLRRKVCIIGNEFRLLNTAPTYVAPNAAIELDAVTDAQIEQERSEQAKERV